MTLIYILLVLILICIIIQCYLDYYLRTQIHIYTITNTMEKWEIKELKKSVRQQGGRLNVIFTHDKMGRLPTGYGPKVMRLYEAIRDRCDTDIICFVDAFDILFGAPIAELRKKYLDMNLGDVVLFSAEKEGSCWPTSHQYVDYCKAYKGMFEVKNGDYGHLNSGMFIGTVKGIKRIIEERWQLVNQQIDDQGFYGETYLHLPGRIELDKKCILFQNLVGNQFKDLEWDEKKKRWFNKHTGSYPVVFQGNGDARDDLFKVVGTKFMKA